MTAKILIVDDEPNLLRMMGYAMHKEGYEIVVAQTGAEALNKAASLHPDLVILDVMMPDMSGLEVCQHIRANPDLETTPIILLSARTQTDDKIAGLEAGADEYVTKPVALEEMVARVRALLGRAQRMQKTQVPEVAAQAGRVLGVIGAKGGVGTTTVALNIAASLGQQGHDVIAAEMRGYFGTFAVQLDGTPSETIAGLLAMEPADITPGAIARYLVHTSFGTRMLFAPQEVGQMSDMTPEHAGAIANGLRTMAAYVVLELPSYPTRATAPVIAACNYVVMVVEPEPASLIAGSLKLELLREWGVGASNIGVVAVNRAASATSMSLKQVREQVGCEVIGMIPPMAEACRAAQSNGLPVVLYQPDIIASQNVSDMAGRLMQGWVMPLDVG